MKFNFSEKNIIITGGSSGIGQSLVQELVNIGANIWIIARDEEKIMATIQMVATNNSKIHYYQADVQDYSKISEIAEDLKRKNIPIHGLINSAGIAYPEEFETIQIDKFQWLMNVNFFGTVNCVKAFLPLMSSGAFIVNISSMAGIIGVYGYSAYGASKFAVRGFSDVLRSELKLKNIQVSIVFPPDTDTPQLEYENQFKPKITQEISGSATSILKPQIVAKEIIKGVSAGKYMIIPGNESKFLYNLNNILGTLSFKVMDMMVSQAVKKINHNK